MSRAIRLKYSNGRWTKAKTKCLQYLRATEKGLVVCLIYISEYTDAHSQIYRPLCEFETLHMISTLGMLLATSPHKK